MILIQHNPEVLEIRAQKADNTSLLTVRNEDTESGNEIGKHEVVNNCFVSVFGKRQNESLSNCHPVN